MKPQWFLWCGEGDLFSCSPLKTGKLYITRKPRNTQSSTNTKSSHTTSHTGRLNVGRYISEDILPTFGLGANA